MPKRHYILLDLIRGISAILVLLFHWTDRFFSNPIASQEDLGLDYPFRVPWGGAAVTAFFMLSGFLAGRFFKDGSSDSRGYLLGRVVRLYPTFWTGVCLTALMMAIFWPPAAVPFRDFLLNFTMLPTLFHARPVDGAYWTMYYELIFSIVLAFIILPRSLRLKQTLLVVWLILSSGASLWKYLGSSGSFLFIPLIPEFGFMFAAGLGIYMIVIDNRKTIGWGIVLLSSLNLLFSGSTLSVIILYFVTLLLMLLLQKLDPMIDAANPIVKGIRWIASISYPLYLIHQMIGFAILRMLALNGMTSEWLLLIPFAVTVPVAWLIHRFIELPTSRLASRLTRRN